MGSGKGQTKRVKNTLNNNGEIIKSEMTFMAAGKYVACEVSASSVKPYLELLRKEVGEEYAKEMEEAKSLRDRGYKYHATVVGPPEMKKVSVDEDDLANVDLVYKGLGRAVVEDAEAWFIVCSSPEINAWRKKHKLPKKDIHVTLGFKNKDVHSEPKDLTSIVAKNN